MAKGTTNQEEKASLGRISLVVFLALVIAALVSWQYLSLIKYGINFVDIASLFAIFIGVVAGVFLLYIFLCRIGAIKP